MTDRLKKRLLRGQAILCLSALVVSTFAFPLHFLLHDHGHEEEHAAGHCTHHEPAVKALQTIERQAPVEEANKSPHACPACVTASLSGHAITCARLSWNLSGNRAASIEGACANHAADVWPSSSPRAPPHA